MFGFLLTLMLIDAAILFAVILMQAGQGGGLASLGGGGGVQAIGGRQATNILTKTTWITGGLFMLLALILSAMPSSRNAGASEVQQRLQQAGQVAPPAASPLEGTAPPATPAPTGGQPQ